MLLEKPISHFYTRLRLQNLLFKMLRTKPGSSGALNEARGYWTGHQKENQFSNYCVICFAIWDLYWEEHQVSIFKYLNRGNNSLQTYCINPRNMHSLYYLLCCKINSWEKSKATFRNVIKRVNSVKTEEKNWKVVSSNKK